jgi:hypothetical protein
MKIILRAIALRDESMTACGRRLRAGLRLIAGASGVRSLPFLTVSDQIHK